MNKSLHAPFTGDFHGYIARASRNGFAKHHVRLHALHGPTSRFSPTLKRGKREGGSWNDSWIRDLVRGSVSLGARNAAHIPTPHNYLGTRNSSTWAAADA